MAFGVTHAKVSGVADGTDPNQIQPSNWNAGHTLTGFAKIAGIDAVGSALGILTQTAPDVWAVRSIAAGSGISVANADGVAGNPTISVTAGAYQGADATLTALAALDATPGFLCETGADTFAKRTLTAGSVAISIGNPAGTAANPTIDVSAALTAVNTLVTAASTGFMVMTGPNVLAARALAAGTGITLTNADGVAGNPQIAVTPSTYQPLDSTLTGLAAINATLGIVVQNVNDGFIQRSLAASGVGVTITNPDGVAGNPTISTNLDNPGMLMAFAANTAPAGWLLCFGQNISRTTYAALFAVIGTTYGIGDGSTTFAVPDLRGRVIAGKDDMGGVSANRLTAPLNGDVLGGAGGTETHVISVAETPAHTHTFADTSDINSVGHTHSTTATSGGESVDHTHSGTSAINSVDHTHTLTTGGNTANPTTGLLMSTATGAGNAAARGGGAGDSGTLALALSGSHTHSGTSAVNSADHTHTLTTGGRSAAHSHTFTGAVSGGVSANHTHLIGGTTSSIGSGTAATIVQPTFILNWIIYAGV